MTRLERIIFYIFLFLIPLQMRTILDWGGNEWNSLFLYGTDIIFGLVLINWIARTIKRKQRIIKGGKGGIFLLLFLIVVGLSLVVSSNLNVSIYRFIKLAEFALLFVYIRSNLEFLKLKNLFTVLIASGAFQAILAIGQFLKQGSLGLKFIEAGIFAPGAPGVATFISNGEKIMRAYGSFPHPNVLAGFLLLCIFCFYALWLSKIKKPWLLVASCWLLIFALFLTFSRVALFVFIIVSPVFFLIRILQTRYRLGVETNLRVKTVQLFGLFFISCLLSTALLVPHLKARFLTISFEEQALDLRFFYNKMALSMIKEKPFLGIGIGNFVWHSQNHQVFLRAANKMLSLVGQNDKEIPKWLFQPVHNIYLLIAVEMGLLGLVAFLLFLGRILLRWFKVCFLPARHSLRHQVLAGGFLVSCFLILGLTDHYFWTLQQGGLMFWLSLALLDQ